MNWLKTGQSFYGNINLREEMHIILYGNYKFKKLGHWVVYRRFNRCQKSEYYSERTKEGVGGPSHTYTDELLRTRRVPTDKAGISVDPLKVGGDLTDKDLYFLEYTVNPKVGDEIYELELSDHCPTPNLSTVILKEKYTIKRVHDYRLENGNVQYHIVSTQYDEVSY